MILDPVDRSRRERAEPAPWGGLSLEGTVFCSLWTSGPDPTVDTVERVRALKADVEGHRFDEGSRPLEEVWPELVRFLGPGPVLVPDAAEFEAWRMHVAGNAVDSLDVIGIDELAALLAPGSRGVRKGLARTGQSGHGIDPEDLRDCAARIVEEFLSHPPEAVALAAAGYVRAWRGLEAGSPRAARILRVALAFADRPAAWCSGLLPGRLAACIRENVEPRELVAELSPACERESAAWLGLDTVRVDVGEPAPFAAEDRVRLDAIFENDLPASFGAEEGGDGRASYRAGQHEVAVAVSGALGTGDLLLVHAPTGTGKTLAYLVPALLWSHRNDVRVGVATYTRTLQQQAMDREMPRALAALARAGIDPLPRVALLKGRENYLCWRALKLALPEDEDDGEAWLGWTHLAMFGLRDLEGDLDRLPLAPPLPIEATGSWRRRFSDLLRQVRGRSACCTHEEDRRACAAEVARKRAERSHLVVTNHAFALARQEFFKHVVFDECEHLHDQAHGAWSHVQTFRQMRAALSRLCTPDRTASTAILDRIQRATVEGTPIHRAVERSVAEWEQAAEAILRLDLAIDGFEAWREEASRGREERESHSLLREYVEGPSGAALVESRRDLCRSVNGLEASLAEITERLESAPLRALPSLRRALDLSRSELSKMHEDLEAWLPLEEGRPAFRSSFFHDVETDARSPRGGRALAARVLLPNEVLGRSYYPELSTGIFVSATTWLRGGFESALGYLGLDRAADPAPDEDRPPRRVRTFRAPEVFDYSRVLVAVPRDAPSVGRDKDAYLDYVRRFVAHLAERTRGRMLVLFTNAQDVRRVGEELTGFFRARRMSLWFQNMESVGKEELSDLFRSRRDSVLLGVDTFWFGADFPGETLEYLVIVRLPYGVPDRYHHAQCAALGSSEHWRRIYMPRALAKFRQGFGRLMRRETDRGCVFLLDGRALEPKHRAFLRELPIGFDVDAGDEGTETGGARLVRGETDRCVREALAHMDLLAELRRRRLPAGWSEEEPFEP